MALYDNPAEMQNYSDATRKNVTFDLNEVYIKM